jgi:branched-chain amino acid transport system ATP-binding protein
MIISNLNAFYDKSQILHGVNLSIAKGEIVALLGRNGSGRSTLAKAIMGLVHATGDVQWRGVNVLGDQPFKMAQAGVAYVPESRDIFPKLTVAQNLLLGQQTKNTNPRWSFEDMYVLFPRLRERANTEAGVLSGGEQQMLTLCRSLMGDPDLIIIDEPTEGLAPMVVAQTTSKCSKVGA